VEEGNYDELEAEEGNYDELEAQDDNMYTDSVGLEDGDYADDEIYTWMHYFKKSARERKKERKEGNSPQVGKLKKKKNIYESL